MRAPFTDPKGPGSEGLEVLAEHFESVMKARSTPSPCRNFLSRVLHGL